MTELEEIREKVKILKEARGILQEKYENSDFHKRREEHPQSSVPPSPEDEKIIKLLTALQQLDFYIKKFQDKQFELIKEQEKKE